MFSHALAGQPGKELFDLYNGDANDHINFFNENKKLIKHFDINYTGWYKQLLKNKYFNGYSFAVKWYATCYRNNGLSLFQKSHSLTT